MIHLIECLPSKRKVLSSNSSSEKGREGGAGGRKVKLGAEAHFCESRLLWRQSWGGCQFEANPQAESLQASVWWHAPVIPSTREALVRRILPRQK
jgi:hypothetical protein